MMMITKVLTVTVGEDNKKTEMYDSEFRFSVIVFAVTCLLQVYDRQSNRAHRSDNLRGDILVVVEYRTARVRIGRLYVRRGRSLLVRRRLQSDDCLLCALGGVLQEEDSRGSYFVGGCESSLW